MLLQMYCDWHKLDTKNRHVSLRKSILNVLKHVTNLSKCQCTCRYTFDFQATTILYEMMLSQSTLSAS